MAAARKNRQASYEASQSQRSPTPSSQQRTTQGTVALASWKKWVISLLVVWHLFVVFINAFNQLPASPTVATIASYLAWYSNPLYANQGYNFFAPEPPLNQLVRYQVFSETGELVVEGEFPNKEQQWPRLLYHRHMMLADQAGIGLDQYEEPTELSLRSYGRHLLRTHNGDEIQLDLVRHLPLYPNDIIEGVDPNQPEQFRSIMSVRESARDLEQPLVEPQAELLPVPGGDQL